MSEPSSSEEPKKPATAAQVKGLVRRKIRKHPAHEEQSLNIYPMMDMMTILLVFLIMQFANQSASVVQSDDLVMPYSTSHEAVEQNLPITISRTEILVDGIPALTLRNGLVDPSQKQGGANGFLITPLIAVMTQHRDRLRALEAAGGTPFNGTVSIIADGRTPFRTLAEVIYTIGQAEFQNIHFVAIEEDAHNRPGEAPAP